ncbi:MAG TPA: glycosyltransferase family 39 protein [Chitinophagaceae bacterium]|jgi:hypothetical protein|nr:glycosyltransferase family 39 protein [Chitinophagaceae bacterium]
MPRKELLFLLAGSLVYFIHGCLYIPTNSITGDEVDHLHYAVRWVQGRPEKIRPFDDASTMPVSAVNTLPRVVEQLMNPGLQRHDGGTTDTMRGRYLTLALCLLTGLFLYRFADALYGKAAAVLAFLLFLFCPNLNGHGALVTTDAFSALFTLTTAYFFYRCSLKASAGNLLLFGASLGIAQLSKQSLTHLLFIFPLCAFYLHIRTNRKDRANVRLSAGRVIIVLAALLLVLNAGFFFQDTGASLSSYSFRSRFFTALQSSTGILADWPLPLPRPYVAGLDLTKNIDEIGGGHPESSGEIYILGTAREGRGFWYYYLVALVLKTPLPYLLIGMYWMFRRIRCRERFTLTEQWLLFLMGYLFVYFSFFYNSQVGIRHVLMLLPLGYLFISQAAVHYLRSPFKWKKVVPVYLALHTLITFYYYFPNLISYTNELVLPKRNAYKLLADSNLDYRQGAFWAAKYLETHPDVQVPGTKPAPGKYLISVQDFLDLSRTNRYTWLQSYQPYGHVQHTHLLLEVPPGINGQTKKE